MNTELLDTDIIVSQIVSFSDNKELLKLWSMELTPEYSFGIINEVNDKIEADVVIIDADKIDQDQRLFAFFNKKTTSFLIVGSTWTEDDQVKAVVSGAKGYCNYPEVTGKLLQAVSHVLKGDIWIQRHLVPKVISELMQMKASNDESKQEEKMNESSNQINMLSNRELDVAKMIRLGESNKKIASALCITERTVKAHLTSIFRKLNIRDRLHLALFIREHA